LVFEFLGGFMYFKKNEIGGACDKYGRRGASRVLVGKPFQVSRILGMPRRRW
jgi:hypothetical protein